MKHSKFPLDCKIANSSHYTRKVQKQIQKTIAPFHFCDFFQKFIFKQTFERSGKKFIHNQTEIYS